MAKKTIAVDLDDVLSANVPAFLEYSNKKWGTNLTIEDFMEDWSTMWNINHTEVVSRHNAIHKARIWSSHKQFKDALPVLNKLKKKYKMVIATSRQRVLADDTIEWLEKYFRGIFEEIHHAGIWDDINERDHAPFKTKADLIKEIGADYLIDDQPKHCIAAAEAGIQAVLFGDYPWNRDAIATKGVARAYNWSEIESYFDGQ